MEKKIQFKQYFATSFRHLTKKNYGFSIPEHFFGPLNHACTPLCALMITYLVDWPRKHTYSEWG